MNRTSLRRIAAPGIAALALSLTVTACGAANESDGGDDTTSASEDTNLSGQLAGAGASSQEKAQEAWSTAFQGQNADVTITYDPVGSGDGRKQFIAKGVSFAGSDGYLKDDEGELSAAKERCAGTDPIEVPAYVSPIAVVYNLDGVDNLQLSAKTIAGIFDGKITKWNDAAIADENPDADLPGDRDHAGPPLRRLGHHGELHRLPEQGRRRRLEVRRRRCLADQGWRGRRGHLRCHLRGQQRQGLDRVRRREPGR